jgi:hypothetical protein
MAVKQIKKTFNSAFCYQRREITRLRAAVCVCLGVKLPTGEVTRWDGNFHSAWV